MAATLHGVFHGGTTLMDPSYATCVAIRLWWIWCRLLSWMITVITSARIARSILNVFECDVKEGSLGSCLFLSIRYYEKLHFHFFHRPLSGISTLALLRTGAAPLRACLSPRSPIWLISRTHATEAVPEAAIARRADAAKSAPRVVGDEAPAAAPQHAVGV